VWKHRDPVERVKALLVREYKVKNADFDDVAAEADTMALKLREDVLAMSRPDPSRCSTTRTLAPSPD